MILELSNWVEALIFTSPRSPRSLALTAREEGLFTRLRDLVMRVEIFAIGPTTGSMVREYLGKYPSIPRQYTGNDLARLIVDVGVKNAIGIRSPDSLRELPVILAENNIRYVEVYSYVTVFSPENAEKAKGIKPDFLLLTSPKIAEKALSIGLTGEIISIGPSTSKTIKNLGYKISCEAYPHTLKGLVGCLSELWDGR